MNGSNCLTLFGRFRPFAVPGAQRDLRLVSAEVLPRGLIPRSLVSSLCRPSAPTFGLCVGAFGQVAGPDLRQLNAV